MILHVFLGTLAAISFLTTLWQWLAARRFPLHERVPAQSSTPATTLLKPLKGCDEHTEACLRSWFTQDYVGEVQILFAVANADDPAGGIVKKLLAEFPQRDAQLVICPERLGTNAKISKLAQLEPLAKHELLVISDADVRVPMDLLVNVVAPLTPSLSPSDGERVSDRTGEGNVGLVSCFYRFANPTTPAMQWEAIAVNADFWSQVLQGASFRKMDFALGAVMATRRKHLTEIGGFRALADCLADDYQLGHRIAQRRHRIELCPVVVECWSSPMGWRDVWRHQLRWARTIRVCQPAPYFFSIVANATLWPLAWVLADIPRWNISLHDLASNDLLVRVVTPTSLVAGVGFILFRIITAYELQRRLAPAGGRVANFWFVPMKDLLSAAMWAGAFLGNRIEWRGERYRLRRDGTLQKEG